MGRGNNKVRMSSEGVSLVFFGWSVISEKNSRFSDNFWEKVLVYMVKCITFVGDLNCGCGVIGSHVRLRI